MSNTEYRGRTTFPERADPSFRHIQAATIDQELFGREQAIRKQELNWMQESVELCLRVEGKNSRETCRDILKDYIRMQRSHKMFGLHDLQRQKYLAEAPGKPDLRTERIQKNTYLGREAHTAQLSEALAAEREAAGEKPIRDSPLHT